MGEDSLKVIHPDGRQFGGFSVSCLGNIMIWKGAWSEETTGYDYEEQPGPVAWEYAKYLIMAFSPDGQTGSVYWNDTDIEGFANSIKKQINCILLHPHLNTLTPQHNNCIIDLA